MKNRTTDLTPLVAEIIDKVQIYLQSKDNHDAEVISWCAWRLRNYMFAYEIPMIEHDGHRIVNIERSRLTQGTLIYHHEDDYLVINGVLLGADPYPKDWFNYFGERTREKQNAE